MSAARQRKQYTEESKTESVRLMREAGELIRPDRARCLSANLPYR